VYVFARGFPVVSRCAARAVEDARPCGVNGHFCRDASISETATLRADLGIGPLYYREVVFATQFEFMCYTVEDAVDWLSTPTA
jgi:hypothetical protein